MLINNHCDFDVNIIYDGITKTVKKQSQLNFNTGLSGKNILLEPKLKHKIKFNPILYIFTLDPNDVECEVICNCQLNDIKQQDVLISLYPKLEVRGEIKYYTVVAENESGIANCNIKVVNKSNLKFKYYLTQLLFVARIYIFIPLLYFSVQELNILGLAYTIFLLFAIEIPCFKRLVKFSKECRQNFNELFKLKQ